MIWVLYNKNECSYEKFKLDVIRARKIVFPDMKYVQHVHCFPLTSWYAATFRLLGCSLRCYFCTEMWDFKYIVCWVTGNPELRGRAYTYPQFSVFILIESRFHNPTTQRNHKSYRVKKVEIRNWCLKKASKKLNKFNI